MVRALLAPAASAACVRQAVECLTALAPHMVHCEVLEQVAHACSDARSRRSGDAPEASWEALEGAIATQAVSVCGGGYGAGFRGQLELLWAGLVVAQASICGVSSCRPTSSSFSYSPLHCVALGRVCWMPGGVPCVGPGVVRSPKPCSSVSVRAPIHLGGRFGSDRVVDGASRCQWVPRSE